MKIRWMLSPLLFVSLFACANSAYSQPSGTTIRGTSPSFSGLQSSFYNFAANQGLNDRSWQTSKQTKGGKSPAYFSQRKAGMVDGKEFDIRGVVSGAKALRVRDKQNTAHPFMQRLFTEYPDPMKNHFGAPMFGIPFRVTPDHDLLIDNMNPVAFTNAPRMTGAPPSDLVSHAASLNGAQRAAEALLNPSFQSQQAAFQGSLQSVGGAAGSAAKDTFDANLATFTSALINVANENAGVPIAGNSDRTVQQAVWMVQQMHKYMFIPLALLLLLPGVVFTQIKAMIRFSVLASADEDTSSPFTGILRAVVAIFLIPATQLFVSYGIDIGNSMTDAVQRSITIASVTTWVGDQTSNLSSSDDFAGQRDAEQQSTLSATQDAITGTFDLLMNYALAVLLDFQLVMICYLFLMGPIAATFFAWPSGVNSLFKPVFANWIDAVTNLVLWRFWWCIILLCMSTRLQWLMQSGSYDASSPWEKLVYCAFLAMLSYVPFMPFEFKPGEMLDNYLSSTGSGVSA